MLFFLSGCTSANFGIQVPVGFAGFLHAVAEFTAMNWFLKNPFSKRKCYAQKKDLTRY
jgi:hypothetical protein